MNKAHHQYVFQNVGKIIRIQFKHKHIKGILNSIGLWYVIIMNDVIVFKNWFSKVKS